MKIFNIVDYGAHFCDRLQTEAIQKAIDDCFLAGGGRVLIPCGIYLADGIRIRSGEMELRKATLEECIEAHPGGIASQDRGKLIFWDLKDPTAPPVQGKK